MKLKKALFLDRDGIINIDTGYVYKIKDFIFYPEIFKICELFLSKNYDIFIITNQSGIARGLYSIEDYKKLTNWMLNEFNNRGIIIKKVYFCPHHPDFDKECDCRKPKPGMVIKAQNEFNINLSESVLIGNNLSDIKTGISAGIECNYYLSDVKSSELSVDVKQIKNHNELLSYLKMTMK